MTSLYLVCVSYQLYIIKSHFKNHTHHIFIAYKLHWTDDDEDMYGDEDDDDEDDEIDAKV